MLGQVFDIVLRAVPIIIGAGVVQFVIFLLKRRSELRTADVLATKTEAESGSVVVSSATAAVALSDQIRDHAVKRAEKLMGDLEKAETELADVRVTARELRLEAREQRVEATRLRDEVVALRAQVHRLAELLTEAGIPMPAE